jgi:adenine-specific DNA-methyltransferase
MIPLPVFEDFMFDAPKTEGIKYAGSKLKLLSYILQLAHTVSPKSVLDGFSGTTRVSQAFAQRGYRVIANDIAVWSKIFGTCYLLNPYPEAHYLDLLAYLNSLPGKDGWFTEHYGGEMDDPPSSLNTTQKRPWQKHNTRKLDAIREEIDKLALDEYERSVVLTSLILALDEVDSTLGHFASYLGTWSPRSYKPMKLRMPGLLTNKLDHEVHQSDIFDLLPHVEVDLAYYDPPYGSNNDKMPPSRIRYAAYYHIWTSICLFDKPELFGKANRRTDSSDKRVTSVFEEFKRCETGKFIAVEAIEHLLQETKAKHIILSYSSGGRATAEELGEIIARAGKLLRILEVDYRRNVMSGMRWTKEWVRDAEGTNKEFLFLIER